MLHTRTGRFAAAALNARPGICCSKTCQARWQHRSRKHSHIGHFPPLFYDFSRKMHQSLSGAMLIAVTPAAVLIQQKLCEKSSSFFACSYQKVVLVAFLIPSIDHWRQLAQKQTVSVSSRQIHLFIFFYLRCFFL